jgi:hypothetical protein
MFRLRILLTSLCVLSLLTVRQARAADDEDIKPFLGEWKTVAEGMEEGWLVKKSKDGKLSVVGQYRDPKTFKILGAFEGKNVEFKDGKIYFTQVWIKKPKSGWGDNGKMMLEIEKGKLKFHWDVNGSKGHRYLEAIVRK